MRCKFSGSHGGECEDRAFWDIAPCSLVVDRRFIGAYCLHHQAAPLKRRCTTARLHGAVSQKALIFNAIQLSKCTEQPTAVQLANTVVRKQCATSGYQVRRECFVETVFKN
jgi:hypothetical protein